MSYPIVNPRDFCNFSFPGAGCNNVVMAAEKLADGHRIVWRIAKEYKGKNTAIRSEPIEKLEELIRFKDNVIAAFIDEKYLVETKIVLFRVEELRNVAKVLAENLGTVLPNYEKLCNLPAPEVPPDRFPSDVRFVPVYEMNNGVQCFPLWKNLTFNPVVTIEIKPKGGVFREDSRTFPPFCETCIFYLKKYVKGELHYPLSSKDFCSLKMFSGDERLMREQLKNLFNHPSSYLFLKVNGNTVHSSKVPCSEEKLGKIIHEVLGLEYEELLTTLLFTLSGSRSLEDFTIYEDSILAQIHNFQKIDLIGNRNLGLLLESLPKRQQEVMLEETPLDNLDFLKGKDLKALFDTCRAAVTADDFSVIVNLRIADASDENVDLINLPNGPSLEYSTKIADYDPITANYLAIRSKRLQKGIDLTEKFKMKPCFPFENFPVYL